MNNQEQKDNNFKISFFQKAGIGNDKETFMENLTLLLSSGMDILSALAAIKEEARSEGMKKVVEFIQQSVSSGSNLARALEKTKIFPLHTISLIRVGEESGRLVDNLKIVSRQEQKEKILSSKIKSAMMYPIFVLILSIIIGTGIAWFLLPTLARVFGQLNIALPLITKILISVGNFLGIYGSRVIPAFLLVLALIFYFIFIFERTKFIGQAFLFALPGIKTLMQETEISRFGSILGGLIGAGIPVTDAVFSLAHATYFYKYKKFYIFLEEKITEGNSFHKSFSLYENAGTLIPMSVQQMIVAAEKSGSLSETLTKIGEIFEERSDTTSKNLSVILEPILLVIVALGVLFIALSVILPVYGLIGGLNKDINTPPQIIPQTITPTPKLVPTIEILETGLDYLNVRQAPILTAPILTKVKPGEKYTFDNKQNGWYEILLFATGTESANTLSSPKGWVSGQYVKEITK